MICWRYVPFLSRHHYSCYLVQHSRTSKKKRKNAPRLVRYVGEGGYLSGAAHVVGWKSRDLHDLANASREFDLYPLLRIDPAQRL